jgi:hypothetical protein
MRHPSPNSLTLTSFFLEFIACRIGVPRNAQPILLIAIQQLTLARRSSDGICARFDQAQWATGPSGWPGKSDTQECTKLAGEPARAHYERFFPAEQGLRSYSPSNDILQQSFLA